jgi:hypothetical protein
MTGAESAPPLFAQSLCDVNAVLIQARSGKGKFFVHRMPATAPLPPASIEPPPAVVPAPAAFETQTEPPLPIIPGGDQPGSAVLPSFAATVLETDSGTSSAVGAEIIGDAAGMIGPMDSPVTAAPADATLDQIPWMPLPTDSIETPAEDLLPAVDLAAAALAPESLAVLPLAEAERWG